MKIKCSGYFDIIVKSNHHIELWQPDGDGDDLVLIFSEDQAKAVVEAIKAQAKELRWNI